MKYFLTIFISLFFFFNNVNADIPRFIDFSKVLNESIAGKKAQDDIKKSFTTESKKFDTTEKSLRESEAKLISQKKLITKEEYQKKANELRDKVSKFSKDRKKSIDAITKKRLNARTELLKILNPMIKKYMEDNKIRLVLDKKSILLGDSKLNITSDIIKILNDQVKSLKY